MAEVTSAELFWHRPWTPAVRSPFVCSGADTIAKSNCPSPLPPHRLKSPTRGKLEWIWPLTFRVMKSRGDRLETDSLYRICLRSSGTLKMSCSIAAIRCPFAHCANCNVKLSTRSSKEWWCDDSGAHDGSGECCPRSLKTCCTSSACGGLGQPHGEVMAMCGVGLPPSSRGHQWPRRPRAPRPPRPTTA